MNIKTFCQACKKPIVFLPTIHQKQIPVDWESYQPGDTIFDPNKHTTHFITCPFAKSFRKKNLNKNENGN